MANNGKALEQLVYHVERALHGSKNAKVESPKYLVDRVTGKKREHDVVITNSSAHHTLQIAIECRDRSRPLGVNAVEAFHMKCTDTGIHCGVMVSTSGFCNTSREKAKHLGIRCLDMEEVDSCDWLEEIEIIRTTAKLLCYSCKFTLDDESDFNLSYEEFCNSPKVEFLNFDGTQVNLGVFKILALQLIPHTFEQINDENGTATVSCKKECNRTLRCKLTPKSQIVFVKHITFTVEFSFQTSNLPQKLTKYTYNDKTENLADIVSVDFNIDSTPAKILITKKIP